MLPSLRKFESMFPSYWDYMTPIWNDWDETSKESILSIALPGYEKEDFALYIEDGGLSLVVNSKKKGQLSYSIYSRFYSSEYDFDSAKAEYKRGILKITIPKVPEKKRKMVEINILD